MKKFLSMFVALAMVLSLFAGFAPTAKAAAPVGTVAVTATQNHPYPGVQHVLLNWTYSGADSASIVMWRIYRSETGIVPDTAYATLLAPASSYEATSGMAAGDSWFYWVAPVNVDGEGSRGGAFITLTAPVVVTTDDASDILATSATLNGTVGEFDAVHVGFAWREGDYSATTFSLVETTESLNHLTAGHPSHHVLEGWNTWETASFHAGDPFEYDLTVLTDGQEYSFVAWAYVPAHLDDAGDPEDEHEDFSWYPGEVLTFTAGAPAAAAYTCPAVLTTGAGYLTDSAKRAKLNYYSASVPGGAYVGEAINPTQVGDPTFLDTCQFIYKMGDIMHGYINFGVATDPAQWYIQLRTIDDEVVDSVGALQAVTTSGYKYPFMLSTGNVSYDGPYKVVLDDTFVPTGSHAETHSGNLIADVFIQYNIVWKTKVIKSCAGFNTIEGWITRGQGQTVLVPLYIAVAYPDNTLANKYDIAQYSSGMFALTFPVDPANDIGDFRVFVRDGYEDDTADNDAMIYEKLSNVPASLSITAATYGSPILLYKSQDDQPVVLSLIDQNGNPVSHAEWAVTELTTALVEGTDYTVHEISPGYYRFELDLGAKPDVRFMATAADTDYEFMLGEESNTVVVPLRDLGAFNPYLDIDANPCVQKDAQLNGLDGCSVFDPLTGRYVCDLLPCTIGSSLWLTVGYWPLPASMEGNWYIDEDSVTVAINGPVRNLDVTGDTETHWIIEKAGKITASISMNVWERKDTTCAWPVGSYDLTNACCHTYTKNFDVCEVLSCTTVSVAVDGANITDASSITVGKSSDLVINVSGANAPAGLFCGCNTKIVKIYMVDADGNVIDDAFTAKTWGGVNKDVTELWYNGIAGSDHSTGEPCEVDFELGSIDAEGEPVTDVNVIDNCEKLTFKDITFNAVTGTDCENSLVVEVFGLYRTFDACGEMTVSYPFISETINDISVNPVITTLSATATVFEMGIDPVDILAGVPVTIEITDPKFSETTSTVTWSDVTWSATLAGKKLSKYVPAIVMTPSPLDSGMKFTFSCAFPVAGDLVITGYQYNDDCLTKEVVTITLKVVMPTFKVEIGLLDGSIIANDHIITEGFGELIYVTATDPRVDGTHNFATDPNWTLQAVAVKNSCLLPTSKVCYEVPSGCTTPSPIQIWGYDNSHIEDAPQFKLYFVVGGCAKLLVDTFTLAPSTVKVTPTEVAFTIPASATHVVFSAKDAHGKGAPGVSVEIVGTTTGVGASGYSFTAGAAKTDKNGEADWAFVPPYSGVYKVTAGITTDCELPCSWAGLSTSAKITANYKAPEIDTTAPVVTIAAGIDGSKATAATLNLTGKVTDNVGVTQLFVGFNKVDVLPDGSFMAPLTLVAGENTITVVAYDAAGNKGTATAKVTYTAPVDTSIVLVLTIGADIVSINGMATSIDAAPEIVASRTFVPIRFIAESFGATVEWLPETQGITITLGEHTVGLQIGNATAVVDGTIISLPAAPYIKNGRTMVPLRLISEAFGGDVVWDAAARTITITYQP